MKKTDKPLNILMVHPHDIYSASEPWTIRITSLAYEFAKMGHKVKLVYFPLPEKERGLLKSEKIKDFETIPFNRRKWHLFKNISKMAKLGEWADILHLQKCFSIASLPAIFSAYINKKPLHYDWDDWEYGIYMYSPPSRIYGWYLNILEKSVINLVDSMSVASDELKKMAVNRRFPEDKIIKVNVCADLERFNPAHKGDEIKRRYNLCGPIVLYLGQLHGAQYADLFIKAVRIVLSKLPNTQFLVVGGGNELKRLKDLAEELKVEKNIVFTGFVSDVDVNKCLAAADVAVACFADTKQVRCKSPLKIAEYLASGKAVVASDVGEIPWMIGDAGILTKPGNKESLADGIISLLKDKKFRKRLEAKARKRAIKLFNWKIVAESLLKRYSELLPEQRYKKPI
jgi:glycosyltransferase involved in cell wall biosynthesis